MTFTEFIILFCLPLVPTILLYLLFKERMNGETEGEMGKFTFKLVGPGATYLVFLVTLFYLLSWIKKDDARALTLRLMPVPPSGQISRLLVKVPSLKIELYPEDGRLLEFGNFSHCPGQEFLEKVRQIPKHYFGKKVQYEIQPSSFFLRPEGQICIEELVRVRTGVDQNRLREFITKLFEDTKPERDLYEAKADIEGYYLAM